MADVKQANPLYIPLEETIQDLATTDTSLIEDKTWRRYGFGLVDALALSRDEILEIRQRVEKDGKWWCIIEQTNSTVTLFAKPQ